jgi:hypothetical protein
VRRLGLKDPLKAAEALNAIKLKAQTPTAMMTSLSVGGVGVGVMALIIVVYVAMSSRSAPEASAPAATATAASDRQTAPLELVSMRHTREGHTLTVTGLVKNPPAGAPLSGVAVLVFAFDRSGEFVASGRGALDVPALQPGEEVPFAVTVADVADVGRYRVSFRTPAGPLPHVDRRAARQLARTP